jgi:hypothetical protein
MEGLRHRASSSGQNGGYLSSFHFKSGDRKLCPIYCRFFAQFEGFSGLRGANLVTFSQILCRKSFSWHYSETGKGRTFLLIG